MTGPSGRRCRGDGGTTLVEVVVGLVLATMAAALLAHLMTTTARSAPGDTVHPDIGLAVDVFSDDVREAQWVVATTDGGRIVAVDLATPTTATRWEIDQGDLVRRDEPTATPRTMATGLAPASGFVLRDADLSVVPPDDADAVRWCAILVELTLEGEGRTTTRAAALRAGDAAGGCP